MTNPNATQLAAAIAQRDIWLGALTGLATAQEYTITNGGSMRKITRADLAEVRRTYEFWEGKVASLTPGARRIRYGVPL